MRKKIFRLRISDDEKRQIAALANKLQRSQSDAVRFVVRQAAQKVKIDLTNAEVHGDGALSRKEKGFAPASKGQNGERETTRE